MSKCKKNLQKNKKQKKIHGAEIKNEKYLMSVQELRHKNNHNLNSIHQQT